MDNWRDLNWNLFLRWVLLSTISLVLIGGIYGALAGGTLTILAWVIVIVGALVLGKLRQRMTPGNQLPDTSEWRWASVIGFGVGVLAVVALLPTVGGQTEGAVFWSMAGGLFGFGEGVVTGWALMQATRSEHTP